MKTGKAIVNGALAIILTIILLMTFDYGRQKGSFAAKTVVTKLQGHIDSVLALPPVIIKDTVIVMPDPVIKWHTKYIEKPDTVVASGTFLNTDSLVNDEIAIYVLDSLEGRIYWRKLGYQLFVPKTVTITDSIFTKVPVFVDKPIQTYYDGIWLTGGVGGGSAFAYSIGLDYSKGKNSYGVNYLRFGPTNNWLISYSRLLYSRK